MALSSGANARQGVWRTITRPILPCSGITLTYNRYVTVAPSRAPVRSQPGVRAILDALGPLPAPTSAPVLVLLVGLPGAGKSTLARRLAPAIGAVVLESNELRRRFFAYPTHKPDESARLFGAINATVTQLLKDGVSVVLDATNLKKSDRRPAINVARTTGSRLAIVHVDASSDVLEQRLRDRTRGLAHDSSDAGLNVLRRMRSTAELPETDDWWHVNTGDTSAYAASVDRIIVALTTLAPAGLHRPGPNGGTMGGRP